LVYSGVPTFANLYVKPENRNQGIGSALTKRCVRIAKQMGIETLRLETFLDGYYERLGWYHTGYCYDPESGQKQPKVYRLNFVSLPPWECSFDYRRHEDDRQDWKDYLELKRQLTAE